MIAESRIFTPNNLSYTILSSNIMNSYWDCNHYYHTIEMGLAFDKAPLYLIGRLNDALVNLL